MRLIVINKILPYLGSGEGIDDGFAHSKACHANEHAQHLQQRHVIINATCQKKTQQQGPCKQPDYFLLTCSTPAIRST